MKKITTNYWECEPSPNHEYIKKKKILLKIIQKKGLEPKIRRYVKYEFINGSFEIFGENIAEHTEREGSIDRDIRFHKQRTKITPVDHLAISLSGRDLNRIEPEEWDHKKYKREFYKKDKKEDGK